MTYLSLILSIGILFFVINRMYVQKRYDLLNGVIITGALIVVLLDLDSIIYERTYEILPIINLVVLVLYLINFTRQPKDSEDDKT